MKDKTLKQLVESIKASGQPKTSAYDTSATVTRVENGTAWVHIPGGVRETPVKLTINAKAGDNVQVRVSGGRAFVVGNATAPPTDDHTAKQALSETRAVSKAVKAVQAVAEKAAKIAGNTNQYFWHTQEGTDTGAHITEIPQEDFLADPENGGGNLLARSNGVAIRDGLIELAQFTQNSATFNDSTGTAMAQFGGSGFFIGQDANTKISYEFSNGLKIGKAISISPTGATHIGNFYVDTPVAEGGLGFLSFRGAYGETFVLGEDEERTLLSGHIYFLKIKTGTTMRCGIDSNGSFESSAYIVPSGDNVGSIGSPMRSSTYATDGYSATEDRIWKTAYINSIRIGLSDYSANAAVIATRWADGNTHTIVERSTNGLSAYFGYFGSSTYQTVSQIRGQDVQFRTSKGTLSADALFKAPGDTWAVDYAGGGYVTSDGKKFQWSVPTPHINGTPTVMACTGFIRQNGNYLLGTSSTAGQIPIGNITVNKLTGFVRITYDASSAPTGVTNNDAISVQLHITFKVV